MYSEFFVNRDSPFLLRRGATQPPATTSQTPYRGSVAPRRTFRTSEPQGVRRSATDIHNTRKKSNNREHASVANGMWLLGELLHALSTRSTQLNLSALSASLGTRFARLGRFPMGRAHPQGAVTRRCVRYL